MTSFNWKRKVGENISKTTSMKFSAESEVEVTSDPKWIESHKRRKTLDEANRKTKSEIHKNRGVELAQQNRFQDAINEFDRAINLAPRDEKLYEMKAQVSKLLEQTSQVLLQLNQPFPALQSAEKALKLNPCWWVAYQTLGRSQLGIGDLKMAKTSFSKAIHINPVEKELWEDDLKWTLKLIEKENSAKCQMTASETNKEASNIVYDEEGYIISEEKT